MGGAGFIYPSKASALKGYGEGDSVKTEIDFLANRVRFWVNDELVGETPCKGGDVAYPVISIQVPAVDCRVHVVFKKKIYVPVRSHMSYGNAK
jgi:hypothetical protein